MRRALAAWSIAIAIGSPAPAAAKPPDDRPAPPKPSTFWRDLVEPHADEVAMLLSKARDVMREPEEAAERDLDWAVEQRRRFFVDGYHLMRYARTLAPENLEVLALLADAADELGKTREAREALEAAIRIAGPDNAGPAITSRLGSIYLRLGKRDQAVRMLRHAQPATDGAPTVHLAHALVEGGDMASAIEALVKAMPEQRHSFSPEHAIVAFSLAVHYDRDEQRAAAFDVLDRLQRALQEGYGSQLKSELNELRLAGPDVHYYRGLLYESLGQKVEARAEWTLYAAFPDAPWRSRALDHVARLDRLRRVQPRPGTTLTVPPSAIRRRLPVSP